MNTGVDTLSRRYLLLSTLEAKVLGFECIKGIYAPDEDFKEIPEKCLQHAYGLFLLGDGFLFKGTQLCIPRSGSGEPSFKRSMGEPWQGTLAGKRLVRCSRITITGQRCRRTWSTLTRDALFTNMLGSTHGPKAFTLPSPSLKALSRTRVRISSLVCQQRKGTRILSWWWWIDSPKWHTS